MSKENTLQRLGDYAQLMRFDKPIGSLLLLWPTLWALWLAGAGQPPQTIVLIFLLGVFLMRSAGCVINDIADRKVDPHVERTRERPLAAGRVSLGEAVALFIGLCLIAFVLVLQLNRLTVALSFAAVIIAATYPLAKRFHHLPQVHLGAAFGWSIPMAYAAVLDTVPPQAWVLFLANIIWSLIYDTYYAMVDREDDTKIGVKSSALLFGAADKKIIAGLQVLMIVVLIIVGLTAKLGVIFYLGLVVVAMMFAWQQYLIRHRDRTGCFNAFLHSNWLGLALFCAILLDLLPG